LGRIERAERFIDGYLQLRLQRVLSLDLRRQGGPRQLKGLLDVTLLGAGSPQIGFRMGQGDVIGLNRPDEATLPIGHDIAVAHRLEEAAEATRPEDADKEVVLVLVHLANDRRELRSVALKTGGRLLMLPADVVDPGVQLGELPLAFQNLLAEPDQSGLRVGERLLQHQRVGLGGGQIADQLGLRLLVLQGLGLGRG